MSDQKEKDAKMEALQKFFKEQFGAEEFVISAIIPGKRILVGVNCTGINLIKTLFHIRRDYQEEFHVAASYTPNAG